MDCLFCKIINGDIPSEKVYEDENVYAFNDISPAAQHHILFIPKEHLDSANDLDEKNAKCLSEIFLAIKKVAKEKGFADDGYRIVNNCGKDGGQTVSHLHFHVIAGKALGWPPFPNK